MNLLIKTKKIVTSLILLTFVTAIFAQNKIQTPNEFLPLSIEKQFTPHHLVVDYFKYLNESTSQLELIQYGYTNEMRPLLAAVLTSDKNMKRLEQIRKNNLIKTGLLKETIKNDKDIAIVWLSFGVHGNEASSPNAAMATAYDLLTNPNSQKLLENTVVIIDPSVNPDGYSRYTDWHIRVANKIVNPNNVAQEHDEPWPGGRVNHYLFDLNRDWAWQTQIETQQRLDLYQQWMPHIHADFHEMGHNSSYFFAPAAQPFHEYITKWQGDFQTEIGRNHAKYFDENSWLYYTREIFDLFYPSYGDTYPTFNGAIGMTYEQGGHGRAGRAIEMENGDTLTLKDRVQHHTTTAISTIEISSNNATRLNDNFKKYFELSQSNPTGQYKSFIIKKTNADSKIKSLCRFLDEQQIRYSKANNSTTIKAYNYSTTKEESVTISSDDLVISAHQPMGVLTQVLFEPEPLLVDSVTYDITAWSLIHAYGLQAYATTQKIGTDQTFELASYKTQKFDKKPYAYLVDWNHVSDAKLLGALLQKNIKVRFATNTFVLEDKTYKAGTLIITQADNRKNQNFNQQIQQLAKEHQKELMTTKTGFSDSGIDIGSDQMQFLEKPNILMLSGEGSSVYSFGHTWCFFEQDIKYPVTIIEAVNLKRTALDDYNTLILSDGSYPMIDSTTLVSIKNWVQKGGNLIVMGSALNKLEGKSGFNLKKYATKKDKGKAQKANEKERLDKRLNHYSDRERAAMVNQMPGAIYKLNLDNTHPLGFGMPKYYFSLKTNRQSYQFLKNTWNVGTINNNPLYLGFVGSTIKERMKNTTVFGVQQKGAGRITYMIDNPLYRNFWEQGKLLFSNAIFFVGS